jgi:diacylglycerol O-acyltransferase / wax synthase
MRPGPPVWVDDSGFDIRQHVQARAVPAPGDEAALLATCSELNEGALDRSRPLWQIWLLTGLADGRAGMLVRLHHAVADGIAALSMIGALFDPAPQGPVPDAPDWAPRPVPGARELAAGRRHRHAAAVTGALTRLRRPSAMITQFRLPIRQARHLAREGLAPRVSLNVPASGHGCLLLARADLDRARDVAHVHGGTVNDIVLAAVAGGARSLLEARGELTPGLVLKASVAVALRRPPDQPAGGNRVGTMIVPLPIGDPDPGRRLAQIARATAELKQQPPYQPNSRVLQRWMVHSMSRQRLVNLLVSNLPGPPAALYFAGARVLEIFQIGIVQGNVTVSVGALSYSGQLNFDIIGDPSAAPDLPVFAAGLSDALGKMGVLVTDRLGF